MDSFNELLSCCQAVNTERVTERKRHMDKLRQLLNRSSVQSTLNSNTDAKAKAHNAGTNLFGWNNIFKIIVRLVELETGALQKGKQTQSATAQNNRERKKQEVSSLFKMVIRLADRRGVRLKVTTVVNHIVAIMKDEFTCDAYGTDYSSVLLKHVLVSRKYVTDIQPMMWRDLLLLYMKMYFTPPAGFDRSLLAQLVLALMRAATDHCDLRPRRYLTFFREVLLNIRQEKSLIVLEHLVQALNVLISAVAADCRRQVCRLGEALLPSMLYLWDNRPTDLLKNEVTHFLHMQITLHHPAGARTVATGAYAIDFAVWKNHLWKLYEAVYEYLQQLSSRKRFSVVTKDPVLTDEFIDLVAELCHQLFSCDSLVWQSSQAVDDTGQPSSKRRRLEVGWEGMRREITSTGLQREVLPWLRVLAHLLMKYPDSLPEEEFFPLVNALLTILTQCKIELVLSCVQQCLEVLIQSTAALSKTHTQTNAIWSSVWTATLRLLSLHQCTKEGFNLLSAILTARLLAPAKDMWNLFFPNICLPTQESVLFLSAYLQHFDIPESFQSNLFGRASNSSQSEKVSYPLRKQLCDWLLLNQDDQSGQWTQVKAERADPELVGIVLTALMSRDPSTVLGTHLHQVKPEIKTDKLNKLEQLCLTSTYNLLDMPSSSKKCTVVECDEICVIQSVHTHITCLVTGDVARFNELTGPEQTSLEHLSHYCCLLTKMIDSCLRTKVITMDSLSDFQVVDSLKTLLRKLSQFLPDFLRGDNPSTVILAHLVSMVTRRDQNEESSNLMAHLLRSITPVRLVDVLFEVSIEKEALVPHQDTGISTQMSNISRPQRRTTAVFNDLDFDIENDDMLDTSTNRRNNNDVEDLEIEEGETQDTADDQLQRNALCTNILSPDLLSARQTVRLQCAEILCSFTGHVATDAETNKLFDASHLLPEDLIYRILSILTDKGFDTGQASDLQMLRTICRRLCDGKHKLNEACLDSLLTMIKNVSTLQWRDPVICAMCLDLLTNMVTHLSTREDAVISHDCSHMFLHLLRAYWSMQEKQCVRQVRVSLVNYIAALIQHAEALQWPDISSENSLKQVCLDFLSCLGDPAFQVRLQAAAAVSSLFDGNRDGTEPRPKSHYTQLFCQMYNVVQGSLEIEGKPSPDEMEDERTLRTSSLLIAMTTVCRISPVCEKMCLFACCQLIREKNMEPEHVVKVFKFIAERIGYDDLGDYMKCHLPYLVNQWLHLSYPIQEFPIGVLGFNNLAQFYKVHYTILLPYLIMHKKLETGQDLAKMINFDWSDLVCKCLPAIIVQILPLFATSKVQRECDIGAGLQRQIAHASSCYDLLTGIVNKSVVERSIVNELGQIVVRTLMMLYNDTDNNDPVNTHLPNPEPNPPHFSSHVIHATLDYLTQSFSGSSSSLVAVLARTRDGIQHVLLSLAGEMWRSKRTFERRRLLHIYSLFVRLILKELSGDLGGCKVYVLREVLYRTIHVLYHEQNYIDKSSSPEDHMAVQSLCISLLHDVCQAAIDASPQDLGKHLSFLVSHLVELAKMDNALGTQIRDLLDTLLIDNKDVLETFICQIDTVASHPALRRYAEVHNSIKYADGGFTLKQEIEAFLDGRSVTASCSEACEEGLKLLETLLCEKKKELSHLEHAEDSSNLLCHLVCELMNLAKSTNENVATEACKCLGQIGPVRLSAISFPRGTANNNLQTTLDAYNDIPQQKKYCEIFHLLNQYLREDSMAVVEVTCAVLKALLSTQTGAKFAADYKSRLKEDDLFHYLQPFTTANKPSSQTSSQKLPGQTVLSLDDSHLWTPQQSDHSVWIRRLVLALLNTEAVHDEVLVHLTPICEIKVDICEKVLPYVVHEILTHGSVEYHEVLSRQISRFFAHSSQRLANGSGPTTPISPLGTVIGVCENSQSFCVMLSLVQYLRTQDKPKEGRQIKTVFDNNKWLDLDYFAVSMAALSCKSYFSAIMFAGIWAEMQRPTSSKNRSQQLSDVATAVSNSCTASASSQDGGSQVMPLISLLSDSSTMSMDGRSMSLRGLLLEACMHIGDPDAMYGCGAGTMSDLQSRTKSYEHEGDWTKALIAYDADLRQTCSSASNIHLIKAVEEFGAYQVMDLCLQGSHNSTSDAEYDEFRHEAAWKLGQWHLDVSPKLSGSGFHKSVYAAMKSLRQKQPLSLVYRATQVARLASCEHLCSLSLESVQSIYPVLAELCALTHIDHVVTKKSSGSDLSCLSEDWASLMDTFHMDYAFAKPVLETQCALLRLCSQCDRTNMALHSSLISHLQVCAKQARHAGRYQISEQLIHELKVIDTPDMRLRLQTDIEEASLYWARSEHNLAKHLMKALISRLEKLQYDNVEVQDLYPHVLSQYGTWLAETRSDNPAVIMHYLEKAVDLLSMNEDSDSSSASSLDAHASLAWYADAQYQNIARHMTSSVVESKRELLKKAQEAVGKLRPILGNEKDHYLNTLVKQSKIDAAELTALSEDKIQFLITAVKNYLTCLTLGDKYDLRVFRAVGLWFENAAEMEVNELIQPAVGIIQSHKFLPLIYQLAARMSIIHQHCPLFKPTLDKLLEKLCIDHPHHTLPVVLALANAYKDIELQQGGQSASKRKLSRASSGSNPVEETRVTAAKELVERLRASRVSHTLSDLETLSEAYIILANWSVKELSKERRAINLPKTQPLIQIKNLERVAVLTVQLQVDPSCRYDHFPYVVGFENSFNLAGGINLPKIIKCIGSDGKRRRQLVKGQDDIRQDAVMQQVFTMVNTLLRKEVETRKRQLSIRTYKVIPLSQTSGLLEWCEGTLPLGDYLINDGTKAAHVRYRPSDWSALDCRKKMVAAVKDAQKNPGKAMEIKLKAFKEICERFQPVMKHFLFERFLEPALWYERQLNYTHSVATNSIVGYILGLGDRHVQNILIDCNTAELVHIDLGVAFEQGKILPTPEMVPFRLTSDIVDGMGIMGVEGVFRRCCEKTMEVMHQNQSILITILQVLLYDPLSNWKLSPMKAYAVQHHDRHDDTNTDISTTGTVGAGDTSFLDTTDGSRIAQDGGECVNEVAERVLLRLEQKLQGIEDGVQLSITGQVNHLIQEAMDHKNLCKLFPGWQPYI